MERDDRGVGHDKACPAIENPLTTYTRLLHEQIELASELEKIADALPDSFDQHRCCELADRIPAVFNVTVSVSQEFLHPVLLARCDGQSFSEATVERLRSERLMDQGYAMEVNGLLLMLAGPKQAADMNAAGYMLRGFFENLRRACAFELEFVVPLATRELTQTDLSTMASLLDRHLMVMPPACTTTRAALKSHSMH
jgi:hypothetical protein